MGEPQEKPEQAKLEGRAAKRQHLMEDKKFIDKLLGFLNNIETLPTIPPVLFKINELVKNENVSALEIGKVVEKDANITMLLLKLINSSFYGLKRKISNVSEAIAYLGMVKLHKIVMGVGIAKSLSGKQLNFFLNRDFWLHSLCVASLARTFASFNQNINQEDAFTGGLLHDVGKIILDQYFPDELKATIEVLEAKKTTFFDAEILATGTAHTTIGDLIGVKWGLPASITGCIKNHHRADEMRKDQANSQELLEDTVAFANIISHRLKLGASGNIELRGVPKNLQKRLSIRRSAVPEIITSFRKQVPEIKEFIDILNAK